MICIYDVTFVTEVDMFFFLSWLLILIPESHASNHELFAKDKHNPSDLVLVSFIILVDELKLASQLGQMCTTSSALVRTRDSCFQMESQLLITNF